MSQNEENQSSELDLKVIEHVNSFGDKNSLIEVIGTDCLFPNGNRKGVAAVKDLARFKARPDDIFLCAYMKCGTHWVWEIAKMLFSASAEYEKTVKEAAMIDFVPPEVLETMPSPRVLSSHVTLKMLPKDILDKKCKLILIFRNPKDVAVSFFHHLRGLDPKVGFTGEWAGFLENFISGHVSYGSYVNHLKQWRTVMDENTVPVHVVYYEDLKRDTANEIRRLAKFLDVDADADLVSQIVDKTEFSKMKQAKDFIDVPIFKDMWKDGKQAIYRKGEMNDWKNWFTVAQNEWFDKVITSELTALNFKFHSK